MWMVNFVSDSKSLKVKTSVLAKEKSTVYLYNQIILENHKWSKTFSPGIFYE